MKSLRASVMAIVDSYGRDGGEIACHLLTSFASQELPADLDAEIMDVLEALTGQCNRVCWIGSGDYHLPRREAENHCAGAGLIAGVHQNS